MAQSNHQDKENQTFEDQFANHCSNFNPTQAPSEYPISCSNAHGKFTLTPARFQHDDSRILDILMRINTPDEENPIPPLTLDEIQELAEQCEDYGDELYNQLQEQVEDAYREKLLNRSE